MACPNLSDDVTDGALTDRSDLCFDNPVSVLGLV